MHTGKISISFILICLFTFSNFFSPMYYFGDEFARLPFVLAMATFFIYIIAQLAENKPILRINLPIFLLILVLLFAIIGTFVLTVDINNSIETFNYLIKNVLLFLLISLVVSNLKELKIYLFVLVICGFGNAYKMAHYPVWNRGRAWSEGTSFSADPNILTLMFVYTLPLIVALMILPQRKLFKAVLAYFIFTIMLGIIEGQSRGGFVALVVMTGFGLLQIKSKKQRFVSMLCVLIFSGIFFARYTPPEYFARMQEIVNPETDKTGSAQARSSAMSIIGKYIITHPFSEYGLGNHSYFIANEYGVDVENTEYFNRGSYLAHNIFLQLGGDLGLIPLLIYIFFILVLFFGLQKIIKKYSCDDITDARVFVIISKSLAISLFGLLIASFFLAGAYQPFLYYLGGCCSALQFIAQQPKKSNNYDVC